VEEELCRLPIAPGSDPESQPGMQLLLRSHNRRMEETVTNWFNNILEADLAVRGLGLGVAGV
jgi:hypothetical protein